MFLDDDYIELEELREGMERVRNRIYLYENYTSKNGKQVRNEPPAPIPEPNHPLYEN